MSTPSNTPVLDESPEVNQVNMATNLVERSSPTDVIAEENISHPCSVQPTARIDPSIGSFTVVIELPESHSLIEEGTNAAASKLPDSTNLGSEGNASADNNYKEQAHLQATHQIETCQENVSGVSHCKL